ncbi:uncharacterized protein ASCRUDRAFT_77259 [Ascoidea rubescens DSM 1968]|uniref:Uncharacterized protein n=1 Tax=Ascoidea rubescens DSM 1968 TaxID=1344418 RepID=A0A1D2VC17_9ASCO|nr:hypothetical protein ASCRUDRAFT_77259 [Ascoidea rubescens DSM 1968]ODV59169.1 hypothetical protein ASCRUDRAFT_77259 [Ascoidea rubescens DSM 1968]
MIPTRVLRSGSHHAFKYVRHAKIEAPKHSLSFTLISKGLGATFWFWIFYRLKEDGAVMFGFKHPWDH